MIKTKKKESPVATDMARKLNSSINLLLEKLVRMGVDLTDKSIIIKDGKLTVQ